jgi:hypothetical protein
MTLRELELKVGGWFKEVPHLPTSAQTWLASNIWWMALVGGIVSVIVALFAVMGLIATLPFMSFGIFFGAHGAWWLITTLISLAFTVVAAVLLLQASGPLRRMAKKGWVLLFVLLLVNIISTAVVAVVSDSVYALLSNLLVGVIFLAIAAYLLYEIRGYFNHPSKISHAVRQETSHEK